MNSHIKLMEKLGTCSMIMPYLNHADRSFLLLTRLSRKSRDMLNYNYEGIMNCIMSTAVCLKIENEDQKELLFLPCDLFKFSINLGNNDELIDTFINFITNINDLKGYYFKEHYIHKRLWIDKIIINDSKVSKLYPILELLKATKTFIKDANSSSFEFALCDLFSLSIDDFQSYPKSKFFPHLIGWDVDKPKIDPKFAPFCRINEICHYPKQIEDWMEILFAIRDMKFKIDKFTIKVKSIEELELFTNPKFIVNKVGLIYLDIQKIDTLSNKLFSNINSINPNQLQICFDSTNEKYSNYISALEYLNNSIDLTLISSVSYQSLILSFKDVTILIKYNNIDNFFKCSNFTCEIDPYDIGKLVWTSKTINNSHNIDENFLHLTLFQKLKFCNHSSISNKAEINQLTHTFSSYLSNFNHETELIIPMKYLKSVDIPHYQASRIMDSAEATDFVKELYDAPEFSCSLKFPEDILNVSEYMSIFPPKCAYTFVNYSPCSPKISDINFEELTNQITSLHVIGIDMKIDLKPHEFNLIKEVIKSPNCEYSLKTVKLYFNFLHDAIDFLDLLSNCHNLECVLIQYSFSKFEESEVDTVIKEAKNKLYRSIGIIQEFRIYPSPT